MNVAKLVVSIACLGVSLLASSAPEICEHISKKRKERCAKKEQRMQEVENNCIDMEVEWHFV